VHSDVRRIKKGKYGNRKERSGERAEKRKKEKGKGLKGKDTWWERAKKRKTETSRRDKWVRWKRTTFLTKEKGKFKE